MVTVSAGTKNHERLFAGAANDFVCFAVLFVAKVRAFGVQGQQLPIEFSLGEACEAEGVLDCCVYGGGVVALTHSNHLWAVTDVNEPRPQRLADPLVEEPPHCMEVMVSSAYGVEVGGRALVFEVHRKGKHRGDGTSLSWQSERCGPVAI